MLFKHGRPGWVAWLQETHCHTPKEKVFRPCRCIHLSSGCPNYFQRQLPSPLYQFMRLIWVDQPLTMLLLWPLLWTLWLVKSASKGFIGLDILLKLSANGGVSLQWFEVLYFRTVIMPMGVGPFARPPPPPLLPLRQDWDWWLFQVSLIVSHIS